MAHREDTTANLIANLLVIVFAVAIVVAVGLYARWDRARCAEGHEEPTSTMVCHHIGTTTTMCTPIEGTRFVCDVYREDSP